MVLSIVKGTKESFFDLEGLRNCVNTDM